MLQGFQITKKRRGHKGRYLPLPNQKKEWSEDQLIVCGHFRQFDRCCIADCNQRHRIRYSTSCDFFSSPIQIFEKKCNWTFTSYWSVVNCQGWNYTPKLLNSVQNYTSLALQIFEQNKKIDDIIMWCLLYISRIDLEHPPQLPK